MSSTLLYLAIVAVWAVVLVPMWLRREPETPASTGLTRLIPRRSIPESESDEYDFDDAATVDHTPETEDFGPPRAGFPPPLSSHRPAPSIRRAAIIARRRRRTAALTLLTLTAIITAALTASPWWIPLPPTALLLGHLALLRTASKIDQARRLEALEARRATRETTPAPLTLEEEPLPTAEIITFTPPQEVFDQYATEDDTPRAVGD
ncbi:hypothetical protein ABGB12_27860 [Actinocorallia sp. B10E7]|uniref:divisome protein SepX/GlpR n=1 Tax=Actinocorallia sp. B10E7 TaxID=3153558 RepID=UPI00325D130E